MPEYNVLVKEGVNKQSVMSTFSNVTDPLVASERVFAADISDQDLATHKEDNNIESIELNQDLHTVYDGWEVEL